MAIPLLLGPLHAIVEYAAHGNLREYLRERRPGTEAEDNPRPLEPVSLLMLMSFCYQITKGMAFLASKKVKVLTSAHWHKVDLKTLFNKKSLLLAPPLSVVTWCELGSLTTEKRPKNFKQFWNFIIFWEVLMKLKKFQPQLASNKNEQN